MARNPFPGWKPGTAGRTTAELAQWTDWYVGALADTARWQASTVRSLGFNGYVEVLTPGVGVYDRKLSTWYAGNLPNGVPRRRRGLGHRLQEARRHPEPGRQHLRPSPTDRAATPAATPPTAPRP